MIICDAELKPGPEFIRFSPLWRITLPRTGRWADSLNGQNINISGCAPIGGFFLTDQGGG